MEMKMKNTRNLNIAAAVLMVIIALFTGAGFRKFLNLAFSVVFAVSLVRNKKDIVALVGAAGLTFAKLIYLLMYFSLGNLLCVLAYAAIFALVLITVLPTLDAEKILGEIPENLRKYVAYIPAAVILVSAVVALI